jgi:hypothetical protein
MSANESTKSAAATPARSRRARIAVNVLLLAGAVLFAFVILEIGARFLVSADAVQDPMLEPNDEYLYRLKPGVHTHRTALIGTEHVEIAIDISPQGLRDRVYGPKQPNEYRIALLGDSFAFGWSAAPDHTISALLEEEFRQAGYTNVTVINLGTGGTGPWQQRGILRDRGFPREPDLVLHQLFLGNDLADTLGELERSTQAYLPYWEARMRQFRRMQYPQYRADRWLELHSRAYCAVRGAIGLPRYQHWLDHLPFFPHPDAPELPPSAKRPAYLEQDLAAWYGDLDFAFERMTETLRGIAADCNAHNADYVAFAVPAFGEVSPARWEFEMQQVADGSLYERGRGARLLYERLSAERLPSFSITEALQAAPDPDALYSTQDLHLNAAGNAIAAHRIFEYLTRDYFPAHLDPRTAPRS